MKTAMLYKLTQKELDRCRQMRDELDTSERERLMQELEQVQETAAGFSAELMQARNALYQLEERIRQLDRIIENAVVLNPDQAEDIAAHELSEIKYKSFAGEGAMLQTGNHKISLEQRMAGSALQVQLTLLGEGSRPCYICLQANPDQEIWDYYILAASFWTCENPVKAAAAHYTSLAQAAASAYLPYLVILYYVVQDRIHLRDGIPDEDYYLDDALYRFLAACPDWRPLPDGREDLTADPPGKKPIRSARIQLSDEGLQLAVEYSPVFGFEYQVLPASAKEEDDEDYLEEHYHLREILESEYLRYYLMLLGAIEDPNQPFTDL